MKSVITLLTDFGLQDTFVGQMKGVLYSIHNDIHIIDLSHGIAPHGIKEGAVTIGMCYDYFPPETIHLCVVDPGVGSGRRPIIVAADNHYFVGPDNGIFSAIYKTSQNAKVVHITSEDYFLKKKGTTFHARDIFSPVAAWLSRGVAIEKFGKAIHDYMKLDLPQVRKTTEKSIEGEIIYIDIAGPDNGCVVLAELKPEMESD